MCDNRGLTTGCCRMSCPHAVALTLLVLLFFVGGAIAGAYAAELIVTSIVPIAIFGIVLLIATAIALYLGSCRCRRQ